jgi:hypothetical protein
VGAWRLNATFIALQRGGDNMSPNAACDGRLPAAIPHMAMPEHGSITVLQRTRMTLANSATWPPFAAMLLAPLAPALAQTAQAPHPETAAHGAAQANVEQPSHEPDEAPLPLEGPQPEVRAGDIVVTGTRMAGQVEAPQKPVETLDEEDIAAYGAASVGDLLDALGPETGTGRGRGSGAPVILVNGQRVASFREIHDYPPEAIRRVEILPEEVALRYGYPPNQRVVNFILKDRFRSHTVTASGSTPDRGGTVTGQGQGTLLRIDGNARLNVSLKANRTTAMSEAERGVSEPLLPLPVDAIARVAGDPDPAAARTLVAAGSDVLANATWTLGLGKGAGTGSLALNGSFERQTSDGLSGLNSVVLVGQDGTTALRYLPGALVRQVRTSTAKAGASLNLPLGQWQLSATVDGSHADSTTLSDGRADTRGLKAAALAGALSPTGPLPAIAPGDRDRARAVTDSVTSLITLTGRPLHLPAGDATLTVKGGFAWTGLSAEDSRAAGGNGKLRRGDGSLGVNLGLPLTSRRGDFGAGLGDLTLNLSGGLDQLSDFGRLTDWSAGLTWGVTEKLSLQASYIVDQAAPSLFQLGAPVAVSSNVPVYDFSTGQTVLVTATSGGNAGLARQQQRDVKLGLNWTLPGAGRSNLIVEYFDNRSSDVSVAFPLLTPAVEAAYGRVVRDRASGAIVSIDQRPVTLASQHESRLRWGVNLNGGLGKQATGGGRFGGAGMHGGGMPGGGRGPRREGRWNVALYHTVQFTDRVVLAPGTAELDLLGGDALAGSGGVARHSLELEAGAYFKGLGLRLNGNWAAPSRVSPAGLPPQLSAERALRFGSVTKLNLRLFVDLGQQQRLVERAPFFNGARVSLTVNNLLGSRQRVTDGNGRVPTAYQPDLVDPIGRVFALEFRKLF